MKGPESYQARREEGIEIFIKGNQGTVYSDGTSFEFWLRTNPPQTEEDIQTRGSVPVSDYVRKLAFKKILAQFGGAQAAE